MLYRYPINDHHVHACNKLDGHAVIYRVTMHYIILLTERLKFSLYINCNTTTMEQEVTAAVPVPGVANHKGPNLFGIFGRKVASESNYNNYSAQALYKDTIWDENNLEKFLTNPKGFIPGTSMVFDGLKNETDRKGICVNIYPMASNAWPIGTTCIQACTFPWQ